MFDTELSPARLYCTSRTWMHDRAAFVHIASEGKVSVEGLRGEGMNGR